MSNNADYSHGHEESLNIIERNKCKNNKINSKLDTLLENEKKHVESLTTISENVFSESHFQNQLTDLKKCSEIRKDIINNTILKLKDSQIKVGIIGSVSTGKSKLLNCLIGEEIFLSAIGKTTNRICRITFSQSDKIKLTIGDEKKYFENTLEESLLDSIELYSSEFGNCEFPFDNHLYIDFGKCIEHVVNHWKGVEFIDTPGYEKNSLAQSGIENVCATADIIILVLNYNFGDEEKAIFKMVSNKTSQLNLFVLVNCWDQSDDDDVSATESSHHMITECLQDWLGDSYSIEGIDFRNRIYFISSKEQFNWIKNPSLQLTEKQLFRKDQFSNFEIDLKSMIENPNFVKFQKHTKELNEMGNTILHDETFINDRIKELIGKHQQSLNSIKTLKSELGRSMDDLIKSTNSEKTDIVLLCKKESSSQLISQSWRYLKSFLFDTKSIENVFYNKISQLYSRIDDQLDNLDKQINKELKHILDYSFNEATKELKCPKLDIFLTYEGACKESEVLNKEGIDNELEVSDEVTSYYMEKFEEVMVHVIKISCERKELCAKLLDQYTDIFSSSIENLTYLAVEL